MLFSPQLSPESVKASQDMGHVLGHKRSSQPRTSYAVKGKTKTGTEKSLLLQDKRKGAHSFGQPRLDLNYELKQSAQSEKVTQSKSSESDQKSRMAPRAYDDNELVKHMSNLPGFLQRVEKDSSIQEKALNFGVLDWKRLEKWKYTERMPGKHPKKTPSSSSSFGSASEPPKIVPSLRKQPSSHGPNASSLYSARLPVPHGSRFTSPQRQPPPPPSSHLNSSKEVRNARYHKEEKFVESIKSKGKETCNQEYQPAESGSIRQRQDLFHQIFNSYDTSCSETNVYKSKSRDPKKETMSEKPASSSDQNKHMISLPSWNHINAHRKRSEMRFDDDVKFNWESHPPDPQNIVLLVPKDFPKRSYSESSQFTESRTSLDGQLEEMTANKSDLFSPQELPSGKLSADIAHSCPLSSGAVEPPNPVSSQVAELDIRPSANSVFSITSEGKNPVVHEETVKPSSSVEASHRKQAEQSTVKGRAPSPTRRFSFSLGKMSRSFSFKESSGVPQLSSTYATVKSGPVRPEASSGGDNFERDQANASSSRGKSSPLRRLLDPFLKHKGAQSSEPIRPPNGSLHSTTLRTTATKGPSPDKKPDPSTFQALLQLTLRNELPFFKLVVNHSNEMLVAAVKRVPKPEKSDPCMIYAFYSVHEIKKKSMNWMNQESKSKTGSLGYNTVGQMKISNSCHPRVNPRDSSECDARECVLYGVDPGQVDTQTLEYLPSKEIAAVIVKKSSKKINDGESSERDTAVILPGGIHGVPIKGTPSSLISRWKSGGSCDCGGWDIGCKLRILADHKSNSAVNHVNLFFVQGGERTSKPVFSLKPLNNGLYSIEFDSSISLLEAFATCVAYVTCWKFPEIIDAKGHSDAEHFPEGVMGGDKRKISPTFQEQIPAKYVTCPPLSPVGRI